MCGGMTPRWLKTCASGAAGLEVSTLWSLAAAAATAAAEVVATGVFPGCLRVVAPCCPGGGPGGRGGWVDYTF
jgi:hypothetical protein